MPNGLPSGDKEINSNQQNSSECLLKSSETCSSKCGKNEQEENLDYSESDNSDLDV